MGHIRWCNVLATEITLAAHVVALVGELARFHAMGCWAGRVSKPPLPGIAIKSTIFLLLPSLQ